MDRAKMFRNVSVIIGQPAYYEISYKVYNERLVRIFNLINEFFLKELMNNEEERYFSTYISPIIMGDKIFDIKGAVFFIPLLGEYHTDFFKKIVKGEYVHMVEANEWFNSISNKLPETIHVTIENYLDNEYESEVKKANKLKTVDRKIQRLKKLNDLKSGEKKQLEEDFRNIEIIVEKLYYKIFDFISSKNEANLNMKLEKLLEILNEFPQDKKEIIIDVLKCEINKQKKVIRKECNKAEDENFKIERSLNLQEIKVGEMMSSFNLSNVEIKEGQSRLAESFRYFYKDEEHD